MALKEEDFTPEQWAEIKAEADRRAHEASETARKNAEKAASRTLEDQIKAAVEAERAKLEADEAGKLEITRNELKAQEAAIAVERKGFIATKKLLGAGIDEATVESLLPMFTAVGDDKFTDVMDTFIKTNETLVKSKVDAAKQELLGNATPPNNPTNAPVGNEAVVVEALKAGDQVGAVEALLNLTPDA